MMIRSSPLRAAALAFVCLLAVPLGSAAHDEAGTPHGELSVTLERGSGPCDDAYLAGRHIGAAEGVIELYAGDGLVDEPLATADFAGEAEADGDGYSFVAGPFEIEDDGPEGYVFFVSWGEDEGFQEVHVFFRGDCGEPDAIEETCVEYALGLDLANGTREFGDRLCITGAQPAECFAYALFVQVEGEQYLASEDFCGAGNEAPVTDECVAFRLALLVDEGEPTLVESDECEAPDGCIEFFVVAVLLDDVVYAFFGSDEGCELTTVDPPCEGTDVTATAQEDGSIALEWDVEAASVEIWRDGEPLATVEGDSFVDDTTEPGETYLYEILFLDEEDVPVNGACLEITAVPFFGAPALVALAGLGGVAAYVAMRRRG